MTKHLLLLVSLAGCEKNLLSTMDAGADAPVIADAPTTCPAVTTTPLPAGRNKLYLNTEGVTLQKCSQDSAPTNCSTIVMGTTTIPQFLPGDPNRQPLIDAIVVRVQEKLAPYSIDVVTTRPPTGDYYMAVLGGDPSLVGAAPQVLSLASASCNTGYHDGVSLEFDIGRAAGYTSYTNSVLSDYGAENGMAADQTDGDCLCRSGNCGSLMTQVCSFGSSVAVPPNPPFDCGRTTQDEPMLLAAGLGCR